MSGLIDPTEQVLSRALDGLAKRQAVSAANLANIDTPGYQPLAVDFESVLRGEGADAATSPAGGAAPGGSHGVLAAWRQTDPRHFAAPADASAAGQAVVSATGSMRNDGNGVDLDAEMTTMAESQIKFGAVSELLTGKIGMLRDVIGGGR